MDKTKFIELFPSKLRKLRMMRGLTQEELGEKVGVGKTAVSEWEAGNKYPKMARVELLCDVLGVPLEYFLEEEDTYNYDGTVNVPLYGGVSCGNGSVVFEDVVEYIATEKNWVSGGEYFYIRAKGDSMIGARIHDGDLLLIRKQPTVEDGEIAVVLVGDEVVLKRVYRRDGMIILQSENPSYPPIVRKLSDSSVRIIGKLKKMIVEF